MIPLINNDANPTSLQLMNRVCTSLSQQGNDAEQNSLILPLPNPFRLFPSESLNVSRRQIVAAIGVWWWLLSHVL